MQNPSFPFSFNDYPNDLHMQSEQSKAQAHMEIPAGKRQKYVEKKKFTQV